MKCQDCNGTGRYMNGLRRVTCPECGGSGCDEDPAGQSDTPRTDAASIGSYALTNTVGASLARQLERELETEKRKVVECRKALECVSLTFAGNHTAQDIFHMLKTIDLALEQTK